MLLSCRAHNHITVTFCCRCSLWMQPSSSWARQRRPQPLQLPRAGRHGCLKPSHWPGPSHQSLQQHVVLLPCATPLQPGSPFLSACSVLPSIACFCDEENGIPAVPGIQKQSAGDVSNWMSCRFSQPAWAAGRSSHALMCLQAQAPALSLSCTAQGRRSIGEWASAWSMMMATVSGCHS